MAPTPAAPIGSAKRSQRSIRTGATRRLSICRAICPFLPAGALAAALSLLDVASTHIGTLATLASREEETSPDAPKIVGTLVSPRRLRAHYFSRARVPFGEGPIYRHLGVYAFRREALRRFVSLPVSPLETREGLEQLRALEDGMRIDAALLDKAPISVDTIDDLGALRAATD